MNTGDLPRAFDVKLFDCCTLRIYYKTLQNSFQEKDRENQCTDSSNSSVYGREAPRDSLENALTSVSLTNLCQTGRGLYEHHRIFPRDLQFFADKRFSYFPGQINIIGFASVLSLSFRKVSFPVGFHLDPSQS